MGRRVKERTKLKARVSPDNRLSSHHLSLQFIFLCFPLYLPPISEAHRIMGTLKQRQMWVVYNWSARFSMNTLTTHFVNLLKFSLILFFFPFGLSDYLVRLGCVFKFIQSTWIFCTESNARNGLNTDPLLSYCTFNPYLERANQNRPDRDQADNTGPQFGPKSLQSLILFRFLILYSTVRNIRERSRDHGMFDRFSSVNAQPYIKHGDCAIVYRIR